MIQHRFHYEKYIRSRNSLGGDEVRGTGSGAVVAGVATVVAAVVADAAVAGDGVGVVARGTAAVVRSLHPPSSSFWNLW